MVDRPVFDFVSFDLSYKEVSKTSFTQQTTSLAFGVEEETSSIFRIGKLYIKPMVQGLLSLQVSLSRSHPLL